MKIFTFIMVTSELMDWNSTRMIFGSILAVETNDSKIHHKNLEKKCNLNDQHSVCISINIDNIEC